MEVTGGHQITWNWSYRWFLAAVWVLGIEPRSCKGAVRAINVWPAAPAPKRCICKKDLFLESKDSAFFTSFSLYEPLSCKRIKGQEQAVAGKSRDSKINYLLHMQSISVVFSTFPLEWSKHPVLGALRSLFLRLWSQAQCHVSFHLNLTKCSYSY